MNLRPLGYEPNELPDCSIPRYIVAEKEGFEPPRDFHPLSVFKTDPFNQAWVFLHMIFGGGPRRTRTYDRPVMSRML